MPVLLLFGAIVVVAGAILLVLWQIADRRVRPRLTAGEAKALFERLDAAKEERQDMKRRLEQLEAIASDKPLHEGL